MAGERKGKVYETVVHAVLSDLCSSGRLRGSVFWNVTPPGMSIEPDFTIGTSSVAPDYGLLVTHCSSPGNSHMKGWRNLGELTEFKSALPSIPIICAITFGLIKEDIAPVQHAAFDSFKWITHLTPERYPIPQPWLVVAPWAADLDAYVEKIEVDMPGKEDRPQWILDTLRRLSRPERKAIGYHLLCEIIAVMLTERNRAMAKLWAIHRTRRTPAAPAGRRTHVRNGLSKALLFPDPVAAVSAARSNQSLCATSSSLLLFDLGLVRQLSVGSKKITKVDDEEIMGLARSISDKQLQHLVAIYHTQGARWFNQVVTTSQLQSMLSMLKSKWASLANPRFLFSLMRDAHHRVTRGIQVGYTWPYYRLLDTIKLGTGRIQGYGLAQLLIDISASRRQASYLPLVAKVAGISVGSVRKRALRSIERLISVQLGDWNSSGSADLFETYATDMAEVSVALAARIAKTDKAVLNDSDSFLKAIFQSNITNGFAVWRLYEPLKELIKLAVPGCATVAVKSCYAESAGENVREDSGGIHVLKVAQTIINWQSCTDSGRDHKKKELCGRAVGLRYYWNGKAFEPRPGVSHLILLLDGSWRDADLTALLKSGWDNIFYPDEMDRLVEAIV